ncbi:hypothetical protein EYB53_008340 [Candidatus Chloroploca sp. M-50]|uniref:Uncharacterized protein n=1 Tax=Candidatus Chloroploca mongolica TaxID=2528176 RepID=A0ABS4D8D1_9CHLR|nr:MULTISPECIES: hypothetical protein [Candidatus Chloroploca]MBP1465711.1 hypothetical protein [Candidatus Chloroploca mongolica]
MAQLRWLLLMQRSEDEETGGPQFVLWLVDPEGKAPPVRCTTVDDLMATLIQSWNQRVNHALPEDGHPNDDTELACGGV